MSKRFLWFREDGKDPVQVELHDVDAVHALQVDAAHWSVEKPEPPAPPVVEEASDEKADDEYEVGE